MKFYDFSHRHGKELMQLLHYEELHEIIEVLTNLPPFPHGKVKNETPKNIISQAFDNKCWELEKEIALGTKKADKCDIVKNKVYIEQEYSKYETMFRDFFRFLLLYDRGVLDVGILICYDISAFNRWKGIVKPYQSNRATLQRAKDFLMGDYRTVVRVPILVIGIE